MSSGPLDEVYEFNVSLRDLIKLYSLTSSLAIDPALGLLRDGKSSVKLYLAYDIGVMGCKVAIYPRILVAAKSKFVHKKQLMLNYISSRPLSLGYFHGGRLDIREGEQEEISESTSLMPHLDVRCRRLVATRDELDHYARSTNRYTQVCKYWFTLLAALAGAHRWGFAWRRIVLSTLAAYNALGFPVGASDLKLLAASLSEFVFWRATSAVIGEDRYLYPEVLSAIKRRIEQVEKVLKEDCREVKPFECANIVRKLLNTMAIGLLDELSTEVTKLSKLFNKCVYDRYRNAKEDKRDMLLGGVYARLLPAFTKMVSTALNLLTRRRASELPVILAYATETWSPIYTLLYAAKLAMRVRRGDVPPLPLLIFFTPQSLPQVIFSIQTMDNLELSSVGATLEIKEALEKPRAPGKQGLMNIEISITTQSSSRKLGYIIPIPLPGKSALPVRDYVEMTLKTIAREILDKLSRSGSNVQNVKIIYEPNLTGILSLLVSLKCLERKTLQHDGVKIEVKAIQ